jgi:pyridinium-3,5-biscarboxylic acid mononucleotide sulfurtransferase
MSCLNMLATPDPELQEKIDRAIQIIASFDGVVVALSAGVDSSLVALLARKALKNRALAITAVSESLAPGELEIAKKTASQIGIQHVEIATDEVRNATYLANPTNRCYYCKNTLYTELRQEADSLGFEAIIDGTQVDDFGDTRPGLLAAREAGVRSPLAEARFSKKDVREAARLFGLEVWDKPAMPCLSSRIPHGVKITIEKLAQVGEAEAMIKRLSGARDIRVRHHGEVAVVEISREEMPLLLHEQVLKQVEWELKRIGFRTLTLGPRTSSQSRETTAIGSDYVLPILNDTSQ